MLDVVFQYNWESVLIHLILIGFEMVTGKMFLPVFGRYQVQRETGRPFAVTADENLENSKCQNLKISIIFLTIYESLFHNKLINKISCYENFCLFYMKIDNCPIMHRNTPIHPTSFALRHLQNNAKWRPLL